LKKGAGNAYYPARDSLPTKVLEMERKLVAILSADVVGYTRLMEIDEAGTLARLKSLRQRLIDPAIASHSGRIVKLMGDGALVEFPSVVGAVGCGLAIQRDMVAAESDLPVDQRIRFRIGINVGDVMIDGDDIYGDGVNVAARLQALAEPGAIAVSAVVREHIGSKLIVAFEDAGSHSVKNMEKPVHVYVVRQGAPKLLETHEIRASMRSMDKLSIAVLPFLNLSKDAEQEYFADGITEDVITELSRFKGLIVIARNSAFRYKGQSPKIQDVGRELAVRWVVEGSVRKAGNRVRITAQLIETETGAHVWGERYDRILEDIFEIQDEVVRAIAGAIPGSVGRAAEEHARRKLPANLSAFDYFLRARCLYRQAGADFEEVLAHLNRAIEADPNYAMAHALLAKAYTYSIFHAGTDPEASLARGAYHAELALKLDNGDPEVHSMAAHNYLLSGNHDLADYHSKRAVELNPNDPESLVRRGMVLSYLGDQVEAMKMYEHALHLDPSARDNETMCDCLFMLRRYEDVLALIRSWVGVPPHLKLVQAAAHALLGQEGAANAAIDAFERSPGPKPIPKTMVEFQMCMLARQEDRDHWLGGCRKAGLDV
jgi:adenylate cyclase